MYLQSFSWLMCFRQEWLQPEKQKGAVGIEIAEAATIYNGY